MLLDCGIDADPLLLCLLLENLIDIRMEGLTSRV